MFAAFYFGQIPFASTSTATTGLAPCGANVFGGFYFGQHPRCEKIIIKPVRAATGGGIATAIHKPVSFDEEFETVAVLTLWLNR